MTKREMWHIVKVGALLGAGFEVSTTIIWQTSDAIRNILNLPIG